MNSVQIGQKSYEMPPRDGFTVAYFLTVADIDRSARFYETVFGGRILSGGDSKGAPGYIQIANMWLIVNVGGGAGPSFVKHPLMIGQLCDCIINAHVPQEPPLGVVDEVAVAGKVDRRSDVGSWCPTRFVGATAAAAVNHIEAVYSGLNFRIGGGGNSHDWDGGRQRQDGNQEHALNVSFHEILHSKSD